MSTFTLSLSKLILPVAALSVAVFGLTAATNAASTKETADDLPIACGIAISKTRNGNTYEGVLHASEDVSGSYQFRVVKSGGGGSATINQSGNFDVAAGDQATLGQATFGGPAFVDAELTLNWNGMKLLCNSPTDI